MKESLIEFLKNNPEEVNGQDDLGYTFLHREAIAGNQSSVEVILELGADKNAKTNSGKTALDFAKELKWDHLLPLLQ